MSELARLREVQREVERFAAELRNFSRTREGVEAAMRLERITATPIQERDA